jgi:hypothetical protein
MEIKTEYLIALVNEHEFHIGDVLDSRRTCLPWETALLIRYIQSKVHQETGKWYGIGSEEWNKDHHEA